MRKPKKQLLLCLVVTTASFVCLSAGPYAFVQAPHLLKFVPSFDLIPAAHAKGRKRHGRRSMGASRARHFPPQASKPHSQPVYRPTREVDQGRGQVHGRDGGHFVSGDKRRNTDNKRNTGDKARAVRRGQQVRNDDFAEVQRTVEGVIKKLMKAVAPPVEDRRLQKARLRLGMQDVQFGGTFQTVPKELLVETVTPGMLRKATDLGFLKLDAPVSNGLAVTRLGIPNSMDTESAYQLLRSVFSTSGVHYNRKYRPLKPAERSADDGWETTVEVNTSQSCTSEACYAPAAIRWRKDLAKCARNLRIGVIDTNVDRSHKTFSGRKIRSVRVAAGRQPKNNARHGTGILSILAGRATGTTPGMVPDAQFYAADIYFADENGEAMSDSLTLQRALLQMESWGVQIVNLSLSGPPDSLIQSTIARLSKKGMVFVAAAGNEGPVAEPGFPAAYDEVIAVTAVSRTGAVYRYANRGSYIDFAAPGVDIWAAAPKQKADLMSGTSLAVPFVTSVVSTLYGSLPRKDRHAVLSAIKTVDLGQPGEDDIFGRGLVLAPASCRPPVSTEHGIASLE